MKTAFWIAVAFFAAIWIAGEVGSPQPASTPEPAPRATSSPDPNEISFQAAVEGAKALKDAMRDPDSFKLTQALIMQDGTACYEYRSRNGFGGMNVGQAVLTTDGTIRSNEMAGFSRAWKTGCAGKSGQDETWEIGLAAGFHGMFSDGR